MRNKFFAALLMVLWCSSAYALSDAEYKKMLNDKEFAQADRQLRQAYNRALNTLKDSKAAQEKLRTDQRKWIASGRDEDAKAVMGRYSRVRAYTIATRARAEDLPDIAKKYLPSSTNTAAREAIRSATRTRRNTAPQNTAAAEIDINTEGYPMLGVCNASNVRLREGPDTKSEIIGSVNDGDSFVLLGVHYVPQSAWYYIDHPQKKGTAYIYAPYVDEIHPDDLGTAGYKLRMDLMVYYGITPEKAKALFGKPLNEERESNYYEGAGREMEDVTLQYPGFNLHYLDGHINHIDVTSYGHSFGDISIGTSRADLVRILGNPTGEGDEGVTYEISEGESFQFEIQNGKVSAMEWNQYMD